MYDKLFSRCNRVLILSFATIFIFTGCSVNKEAEKPMTRDKMILDRLENAEEYYALHPNFEKAFTFLRKSDLAELPSGRYEIDGERLFCILDKSPGRSRAEAKLEAHRKYIDIQYVIAGVDDMGWKPTSACTQIETAYNSEKDIMFFDDEPKSWTEVPAGSFVIFFHKDAHAPLVGREEIHKAVLKVAVQ